MNIGACMMDALLLVDRAAQEVQQFVHDENSLSKTTELANWH